MGAHRSGSAAQGPPTARRPHATARRRRCRHAPSPRRRQASSTPPEPRLLHRRGRVELLERATRRSARRGARGRAVRRRAASVPAPRPGLAALPRAPRTRRVPRRRHGARQDGHRAGPPSCRPGPHLVVCPLSVVHNWFAEAARFTPILHVVVHHGADRDLGLDELVPRRPRRHDVRAAAARLEQLVDRRVVHRRRSTKRR